MTNPSNKMILSILTFLKLVSLEKLMGYPEFSLGIVSNYSIRNYRSRDYTQ